MTQELLERAWKEIGRFIWVFMSVELVLDQAIIMLFSLKSPAETLFLNSIDMRKKIKVAQAALTHQGRASGVAAVKQLHDIHDLRNKIAHKTFLPTAEAGAEGILFSWSTVDGKIAHKRDFHSFEDLERQIQKLRDISDVLVEVEKTRKPLTDDDAVSAIREMAETDATVIEFPRPPRS